MSAVSIPVVVINGPTASGKTGLAVTVAQALRAQGRPAEVVNTDSMLVYRGMDIGTAKPSLAERAGVPHHLIDILEITEEASVARLQELARAAIADCRGRGVVPILVGGSALYVHAIVDEFSFPATDPVVRSRLEAELEQLGNAELHARLAARAPEVAAGILPGNGRRIVRALEVLELTGSFSSQLPQWRYALEPVLQYALDVPRDELDARIGERVEAMWAAGLVAEVAELERRGLREGRTACRAIGYRQVLAFLAGECGEAEAKQAIVQVTRRFARKQLGWLRRDPRIVWLSPGRAAGEAIVSEVQGRLQNGRQENQ
ncbi:tRNA dimethylallyltransferase [Propionicimonas paludicola]|uniref:tRNA dimethylallyltransferase n=1 Tax=Propionicimonas paludicola TaxID=185243 RepID=A0A2A9CSM2_9ACTN|nr:tRNA (adenosine(37)-N6)-dimethylallyltransferase MiaA [Propionicimonas paludicola]PFG16569.1 tRNA dimethylallyltransferase [Propionicimonas paludicola]